MSTLVNLDGKIVAPEDALVSVFDRSFLFGDGVYDTLRTYRRHLFALDEHLGRFFQSAEKLRMNAPADRDEIVRRCRETIEALPDAEELYCRIVLSRGVGEFGLAQGLDAPGRLIIIVRALEPLPRKYYDDGVAMVVSQTRRMPAAALDPAIKSGNYLNNILAAFEAHDAGAFDAVLLNVDGYVSEATTSSIFAVLDGTVVTPPLNAGILEGVTRALTLEVARAAGLPAQPRDLSPDQLRAAEEVFITSTLKEIMPVVSIDGTPIGDGKPGEITRRLMGLLHEEILRRVPPRGK